MGEKTGIEWCDHTFNPWWGCEKISPGCAHCYAATLAGRFGTRWGALAPRRSFGEKHWREPLAWDRAARAAGERRRVFCASMADVFEQREDLVEPRGELVELIHKTPNLDWLLLTKRPENIAHLLGWAPLPPNAWLGISAENQALLESRFVDLLRTVTETDGSWCDERILFLSLEPLLGPIVIPETLARVDWVIVGGESGANARPLHPSWLHSLHDQCREAGVPFFFKQWGEWAPIAPEQWRDEDGFGVVWPSGMHGRGLLGGVDPVAANVAAIRRVGKRAAGALLGGHEHKAFPVRQPCLERRASPPDEDHEREHRSP